MSNYRIEESDGIFNVIDVAQGEVSDWFETRQEAEARIAVYEQADAEQEREEEEAAEREEAAAAKTDAFEAGYDRLLAGIDALGLTHRTHYAQTGTRYIEVAGRWTIRYADHGDAYGRADYTADGLEGTVAGALEWLREEAECAETGLFAPDEDE